MHDLRLRSIIQTWDVPEAEGRKRTSLLGSSGGSRGRLKGPPPNGYGFTIVMNIKAPQLAPNDSKIKINFCAQWFDPGPWWGSYCSPQDTSRGATAYPRLPSLWLHAFGTEYPLHRYAACPFKDPESTTARLLIGHTQLNLWPPYQHLRVAALLQ